MAENKTPTLQLSQAKVLHAFNASFCANLPQNARAYGHYIPEPGDALARQRLAVPDGRYRLAGSDYVFTIAGGRLKEAMRADPPHFGGDNVVAVAFDAAGVTTKGE
jgi:hypothetical protein